MVLSDKVAHNNLLVIEDNPADVELVRATFDYDRVMNELTVVSDGEEALDYVFQRGVYSDAVCPDVILLDIYLPKINGLEVLREIKSSPQTRNIPIVIMTASDVDSSIVGGSVMGRSIGGGSTVDSCSDDISSYIVKPVNLTKFLKVIRSIENFRLSVVTPQMSQ
jgi:CheY-like chemotaxis protein